MTGHAPAVSECMGCVGLHVYTGPANTHTPPHTSVTWPVHVPRKRRTNAPDRAPAERCCGQIGGLQGLVKVCANAQTGAEIARKMRLWRAKPGPNREE